ncbi:MAG: tRNA (N6-isopentenyl adenosine(37)-C2)-methylthiotransferase MiaB [Candidatus Omnitrophica bacterium]|nr:tRNA (N6-isopentenyl adenosine(37)-C2)-methylthiotransferase MiaB [Candidatus Omnitrophota bacterium]
MTKKVFIKTLGCQMNEYDTELVRAILTKADFGFVEDEDKADIVLLNTCSVRENAHRKVYGHIHSLKHRRNGNPVMIGILGCMATGLREDLLNNRHLGIDFIAGPDSYKRLPELIEKCCSKEVEATGRSPVQKPFDVTLSEFETYSDVYPSREQGINAWIAIMRGCDNFCTFCVVPYTRGRERSRSPENVLKETRRLVKDRFKQVTLLGQNVNSYKHEGSDFADLIEVVANIEGIKRVRFMSPHPKDFPGKLLDVMADNPKICKHIHLPLQAGNDRILNLMNRTYTQAEFLKLVDKFRAKCPQISLTTDIIVGFPSETDTEFEDTVRVMEKVGFDAAFIFKYSQRKGTIAARKYPDDVPGEKKTERIVRLNQLQKEISRRKNRALIGSVQEVLIESASTTGSPGSYYGRSDGNKTVIVAPGDYAVGDLIQATVTDASPNDLKAEIAQPKE